MLLSTNQHFCNNVIRCSHLGNTGPKIILAKIFTMPFLTLASLETWDLAHSSFNSQHRKRILFHHSSRTTEYKILLFDSELWQCSLLHIQWEAYLHYKWCTTAESKGRGEKNKDSWVLYPSLLKSMISHLTAGQPLNKEHSIIREL